MIATLCSKCQIDGEDPVNFCGLLRKHELYHECCSKNEFNAYFIVQANLFRFYYLTTQGYMYID